MLYEFETCSKLYNTLRQQNVALKIVCRRHVTRIDFLCNNIALKIVCRRHVTRIDFLCDNIALKIFSCDITFIL